MKGEDNARFLSAYRTLIRRVLDQTLGVLENNGVMGFEDMMELGEGAYSFTKERSGGRAFRIQHETLPEELEGGKKLECPSCRFQHGAILASSSDTRLEILDIVDLNWSEYRTELWLPWLHCDDGLTLNGFIHPRKLARYTGLSGSLYVSRSEPRLQDIVDKILFVYSCLSRKAAPSGEGCLTDIPVPRVQNTQKIVIPRGDGRYIINLRPDQHSRMRSVQPMQYDEVQVHSKPDDYKNCEIAKPAKRLGSTDSGLG
jgi:hypothetical protein